jgi:site-specific DNA recombinase
MDEKTDRNIPAYIQDLVNARRGRKNGQGASPNEFGSNPLLAPVLAPTLIYLRVSTKGQLDTALDIDPNGLSIATQQSECVNKVDAIGGELVHQPFIEGGISAKDVEHRPAFKQMLAYIHANPGIKYVITYNRARAFRNHFDAAIHIAQLQKLGVRLITVKDDFGEGPAAIAMEGMLDVMNGLMNTMNGLDVAAKMGYKATHGGTIGRAKLGYLNTKTDVGGKQVSTVILDPERAALVHKAWELYATGEYGLERLEATMADLGLTARPAARNPQVHPVSANKLDQMLGDPYYLGYVVYKGDIYPGNHEPLVDEELFQRVLEVRDLRSAKGQRDRVHQHYLKGGIFCDRCHRQGRTSRLIFTQHTGRAGKKYAYFVCRGRQDGLCDLPHLRIENVEDAVVEHYRSFALPAAFVTQVREILDRTLDNEQTATKELHASLSRRIRDLDLQENRLIDALADGSLPGDKIRAKLRDITIQKDRLKVGLADTSAELAAGGEILRRSLELLVDPYGMYRDGADNVRRLLNQTFFDRFYVDETTDTIVPADEKTPLFAELHEANRIHQRRTAGRGIAAVSHAAHGWTGDTTGHQGTHPEPSDHRATHRHTEVRNSKNPRDAGASVSTDASSSSTVPSEPSLADVLSVSGSSTALMVGDRGFEPLTPTTSMWCSSQLS